MHLPLPDIKLQGKGISRTLSSPVLQSPLAGVTDQVFRGLVRRWAPDSLLFTEMVNASSFGHDLKKVREISKEEGPLGVQIFDYRPDAMAEAAKKAEELGAFLVDINMGCPVKKIANKGGGSALLKDPNLAAKIVKSVAEAINIPVTVKTRIGWSADSPDPIYFSLRLQEAGAQLITLHGRTREQAFKGKANWDTIKEVKEALNIPVIANGDINNPIDAYKCLEITKADGIMIGRGSLGAPWLVGQIENYLQKDKYLEPPKTKEKIQIIIEQLNQLIEIHGEHGLLIARKHFVWSCSGFLGCTQLKKDLLKTDNSKNAIEILRDFSRNIDV